MGCVSISQIRRQNRISFNNGYCSGFGCRNLLTPVDMQAGQVYCEQCLRRAKRALDAVMLPPAVWEECDTGTLWYDTAMD